LAIGVAVFSLVGSAIVVIADDTSSATTKPSREHAAGHHDRIGMPFSLLTDLTDDQKTQIAAIHKTELDAEKALKDKEKDDVMALLTDQQKTELTEAEAKIDAEKKADAEAKRAKVEAAKAEELKNKADNMSTTQPAGDGMGN
jgi:Spy/CpxP family protein refolding chaperone